MFLDFIADTRLLYLIHFSHEEVWELFRAVRDLETGRRDTFLLHQMPGVESIDDCRLTLRSQPARLGLGVFRGSNDRHFTWALDTQTWRQCAILIGPFLTPSRGHFQWLPTPCSDIEIRLER